MCANYFSTLKLFKIFLAVHVQCTWSSLWSTFVTVWCDGNTWEIPKSRWTKFIQNLTFNDYAVNVIAALYQDFYIKLIVFKHSTFIYTNERKLYIKFKIFNNFLQENKEPTPQPNQFFFPKIYNIFKFLHHFIKQICMKMQQLVMHTLLHFVECP